MIYQKLTFFPEKHSKTIKFFVCFWLFRQAQETVGLPGLYYPYRLTEHQFQPQIFHRQERDPPGYAHAEYTIM